MALNVIQTREEFVAWMLRMNLNVAQTAKQLGHNRASIYRYVRGVAVLPQKVARLATLIEASRAGKPFKDHTLKQVKVTNHI